MGGGIHPSQRLNENRYVKRRELSVAEQEEMAASVMPDFISEHIEEIYQANKRARTLIALAQHTIESYGSASSDVLKYNYANKYRVIYEFTSRVAEESPILDDHSLAEIYSEIVPGPTSQDDYEVVEKLRPWTSERPKKLSDIPQFNHELITEINNWVKNYNARRKPETVNHAREKPRKTHGSSNDSVPYYETVTDQNTNAPKGQSLTGFKINYRLTKHFLSLLANPDTGTSVLQTESLALAILAFSIDPTMSIESARNIARTYLDRYPENMDFIAKAGYYAELRKKIAKGYTTEELEQTYFFTNYGATILVHDFHVKISEHALRELTGQNQKEMAHKFQLHRIDECMKKYLATTAPEDFAKVLHAVTRSRFLMVSYFADDFRELKTKRSGGIIRKYESIFLPSQFPEEGTVFIKDSSSTFTRIHKTIELGVQSAKFYREEGFAHDRNEFFEMAIDTNEHILSVLTDLRAALSNYEQDKIEWGNRTLTFLTLGLELMFSYFTAGIGARLKPLLKVLLNIAQTSLTQAFYRYIGVIDKLSVTNLAKDIAIGMFTDATADKFAERFVNETGIALESLKGKAINMIVSNFMSTLEQEIISLSMGSSSMDDFLRDMLRNFSTGVIHESVANKVIASHIARFGKKFPDLGHSTIPHAKPVHADPTSPHELVELPATGINTHKAIDNTLTPVDEHTILDPKEPVTSRGFAKLDEEIVLMHGTSPEWSRKIDDEGGFKFDPENHANSDFGAGVYFTFDKNAAFAAAQRKTKGQTAILVFELHPSELGKIVDIRPGGKHRDLWVEHLNADAGLPKLQGRKSLTNADILAFTPEKRRDIFEDFLNKNGLGDVETVIGPLGDEFTTGTAVPVNEHGVPQVSNQIAIRSNDVLQRINNRILAAKNSAGPMNNRGTENNGVTRADHTAGIHTSKNSAVNDLEPIDHKQSLEKLQNKGQQSDEEPSDRRDSKEPRENDREPVANKQPIKKARKTGRQSPEPNDGKGAEVGKKGKSRRVEDGNKSKQSKGTKNKGTNKNGVQSTGIVKKPSPARVPHAPEYILRKLAGRDNSTHAILSVVDLTHKWTSAQGNVVYVTPGNQLVGTYRALTLFVDHHPDYANWHAHHIVEGVHLENLGIRGFFEPDWKDLPCVLLPAKPHSKRLGSKLRPADTFIIRHPRELYEDYIEAYDLLGDYSKGGEGKIKYELLTIAKYMLGLK